MPLEIPVQNCIVGTLLTFIHSFQRQETKGSQKSLGGRLNQGVNSLIEYPGQLDVVIFRNYRLAQDISVLIEYATVIELQTSQQSEE